jgi:hypothetical protein
MAAFLVGLVQLLHHVRGHDRQIARNGHRISLDTDQVATDGDDRSRRTSARVGWLKGCRCGYTADASTHSARIHLLGERRS